MTARYAVYYAPPPQHPLTALASAWLGRDAWMDAGTDAGTDAEMAQVPVAGLDISSADRAELTADAAHYGFHATLKAPFELAAGQTEAGLIAALNDFAATQPAFAAELAVNSLSGFVALTLDPPCPAMTALHTACVHEFEPFRAPLSDADLARRRRAPMTAEQDARMIAYGYPWIFDEFRFHMTLTGRIRDDARRSAVIAALAGYFAPAAGRHHFDSLCLFYQSQRDAPFRIIASAALQAAS